MEKVKKNVYRYTFFSYKWRKFLLISKSRVAQVLQGEYLWAYDIKYLNTSKNQSTNIERRHTRVICRPLDKYKFIYPAPTSPLFLILFFLVGKLYMHLVNIEPDLTLHPIIMGE